MHMSEGRKAIWGGRTRHGPNPTWRPGKGKAPEAAEGSLVARRLGEVGERGRAHGDFRWAPVITRVSRPIEYTTQEWTRLRYVRSEWFRPNPKAIIWEGGFLENKWTPAEQRPLEKAMQFRVNEVFEMITTHRRDAGSLHTISCLDWVVIFLYRNVYLVNLLIVFIPHEKLQKAPCMQSRIIIIVVGSSQKNPHIPKRKHNCVKVLL